MEKTTTTTAKADTGSAYKVLVKPLLSEKGFKLNALSQYVFKVSPKANKIEIRKAIERVYDVHVTRVNVMNIQGKTRNFGKTAGRTSDWRKAIITLKKGETIGGAK